MASREPKAPGELLVTIEELLAALGRHPDEAEVLALVFVINNLVVRLPSGRTLNDQAPDATIREACDSVAHLLGTSPDALKAAYWSRYSRFVGDTFKELVERVVDELAERGVDVED